MQLSYEVVTAGEDGVGDWPVVTAVEWIVFVDACPVNRIIHA
jgi:hypothetical protein